MYTKKFKWVLIIIFIVGLLIIIISSPLFNISIINIYNNKRVTEEEILRIPELKKGNNIFKFSKQKVKEKLKKNSYVKDVTIKINVINREINVILDEYNLSGYVQYKNNTFLYIDKDGVVIKTDSSYTEKLPVIIGMKFDKFYVGQAIETTDKEVFKRLVLLTNLFDKHDIDSNIVKVSLEDEKDIHLFVDNIDVSLGMENDLDEKISILKSILQQVNNKDIKYTLSIKDIKKPYLLKILN